MRNKQYATLQLDSVNNRKSSLHYVKLLRNGQQAHLWFYSHHCLWGQGRGWNIGLYIGDSAKDARKWFMSNGKGGITGTYSIEGLKWAMETVAHVANRLPLQDTIYIEAADSRRGHLYRLMLDKMLIQFDKKGYRHCRISAYV